MPLPSSAPFQTANARAAASPPPTAAWLTVAGIRLHYLDWGGSGPALVLVPGLGNSAHVFDDFAPRLTDTFRVLAVTRVGYGESDQPKDPEAYTLASRVAHLAALLHALDLLRAVLVGHSLAGDELTAFASAHPDRTAALVYLDAAYDHTAGEHWQQALAEFLALRPPMTEADRASAAALQDYLWAVQGARPPIGEVLATMRFNAAGAFVAPRLPDHVRVAMQAARVAPDYAGVRAPALALYADARTAADRLPWLRGDAELDARATAVFRAQIWRGQTAEREQFARAVAGARVESFVANHHNFLSHPAEVERRLRDFLHVPAADPDRLARDLAAPVPDAPLRAPAAAPPAAELPAALREAAPGTFELQLPGKRVIPLVLHADAERVLLQVAGQPAVPLTYLGDATFGAPFDPTLRLRLVVDGAQVVRVVLQQAGHTLEGARRES